MIYLPEREIGAKFKACLENFRTGFFGVMAFWNRNKILSDKELAEGIIRGDETCYEKLFERYYVIVRKFIMGFIGDRPASEDLAQELFIRLWNRRLSIDPQKSLRNWLIISARNAALNWLKAKSRSPEAPIEAADTVEDGLQPVESLYFRQLATELDNAISALPGRRKQIFKMSRLDHLPNEEIASRLGLSVRTVEKHIELALKNLRSGKYSS